MIDIDECAVNNGGCEHDCTNQNGGYTCGCQSGFQLDTNDLTSCSGITVFYSKDHVYSFPLFIQISMSVITTMVVVIKHVLMMQALTIACVRQATL